MTQTSLVLTTLAQLILGPVLGVWLNSMFRMRASHWKAALLAFLIAWLAVSIVAILLETQGTQWQAIVIAAAVPVGVVLLADSLFPSSLLQRILLVGAGLIGFAGWVVTSIVVQLLFFPPRR